MLLHISSIQFSQVNSHCSGYSFVPFLYFFSILRKDHMLQCALLPLVMFWRLLGIFLCLPCVCCWVSFSFFLRKLCYIVGIYNLFLIYILHCTVFRVFDLFPTTILMICNALFVLALILKICSSQLNLL